MHLHDSLGGGPHESVGALDPVGLELEVLELLGILVGNAAPGVAEDAHAVAPGVLCDLAGSRRVPQWTTVQ